MRGIVSLRRVVHAIAESATAPDDTADVSADGGTVPDGPISDEPLQPPDDRVLTLVYESGGCVWQQDVIIETGYSAEAVAELLGEMEADGKISRSRMHGKTVITYPTLRAESNDTDS